MDGYVLGHRDTTFVRGSDACLRVRTTENVDRKRLENKLRQQQDLFLRWGTKDVSLTYRVRFFTFHVEFSFGDPVYVIKPHNTPEKILGRWGFDTYPKYHVEKYSTAEAFLLGKALIEAAFKATDDPVTNRFSLIEME